MWIALSRNLMKLSGIGNKHNACGVAMSNGACHHWMLDDNSNP